MLSRAHPVGQTQSPPLSDLYGYRGIHSPPLLDLMDIVAQTLHPLPDLYRLMRGTHTLTYLY